MSVLLLGSIGIAALQIVLRNVFSYSLFWADELIRMSILWLAMIGAMVAASESRHIAITIVPRYFPKSWHRPASILSMTFAAMVSGLLAWQSFRFVADSLRYGDTVLGELPAWAFQAIMPFGFAVICLRFLRHIIAEVGRRA
jgi:TRAP-type C4-dicarboxylate transport system permease small subunit